MKDITFERIARAKYLLHTARHIAMATVNEDGSPHNTPLAFFYDSALNHIYWSSSPEALHSQNICRTGQAFFALYESNAGGGLFIKASMAKELAGDELDDALELLNMRRAQKNKPPVLPAHYSKDGPQRLYRATIANVSINYSKRDVDDVIVQDIRQQINKGVLL